MNNIASESVYQSALEQVLGGTHKRMGIYGVSDITTDQFHAEIKTWLNWRMMLAQLLIYNAASSRSQLRAYVFGERPSTYTEDDVKAVLRLFTQYGITMYHVTFMSASQISITNLSTSEITEHVLCDPIRHKKPKEQLSELHKTQIEIALKSNSIDLDDVASWLRMRKEALAKTLHASYTEGSDYFVTQHTRIPRQRGGHNRQLVTLTLDCFKRLCMRSKGYHADLVCAYF